MNLYRTAFRMKCSDRLLIRSSYQFYSGSLKSSPLIHNAKETSSEPSNTDSVKKFSSGIAVRLGHLKRLHLKAETTDRKAILLFAWKELQNLSDADIEVADAKSVSGILLAWAYFSKYWRYGKDGPFPVCSDDSNNASSTAILKEVYPPANERGGSNSADSIRQIPTDEEYESFLTSKGINTASHFVSTEQQSTRFQRRGQ